MSDELIGCSCGFKCSKSQLGKSKGYCPKCGSLLIDGLEATMNKPKKDINVLNEEIKTSLRVH